MDRPTWWSFTCAVVPPAGRSFAPIGRFPARSSTCCLPDRSSTTRWAAAHTSGSSIAPQPPSTRFAKRAIHSSRVVEVEAAARPPPSPLRAAREVRASPRSRRCSQSVARRLPGALRASRRDWLIQEWWKAGKDPTIRGPRWSVPRSQSDSPVVHEERTEQPPAETPTASREANPPAAVQQPSPTQQKTRQFSFESSSPPSSSSSSSGGEFGGPSSGGGGSGGGGGGSGGGGFGIEG